jgi:CDP-diacylglycerol--glycerol-3-phosphate 3-phosphatidyltransferase
MIDGRRERVREQRLGEGERHSAFGKIRLGERLARRGVPADAITCIGVALAAATGVAAARGEFYLAVVLLIIGGLMDTLDGVVAKAAGTSSSRGAFFDSVSDRVADGLIFGGVAYYMLVGRDPKDALLPIAILAMSGVVSYERAKAESLGFSARGGLMERAERLILLGIAFVLHVVLVPLLIVLLVLTTATAIGRFVRVWMQASDTNANALAFASLRGAASESRWRIWRETTRTHTTRRSRRETEPLTTRLRRALGTERQSSTPRMEGSNRNRSARALRRRMGNDR